jgi:CheY-like chemotaxis protein
MRWSVAVCALYLGLPACAPRSTSRPVAAVPGTVPLGSPSDMTTAEGDYHGYEVYRCHQSRLPSDSPWWLQGAAVVGKGTHEFSWLVDKPHESTLISQMREQVLLELTGLDVQGTGVGVPCHGPRLAFVVTLRDWREVDEAVRRLGTWLVREDIVGEVLVEVVVPTYDVRSGSSLPNELLLVHVVLPVVVELLDEHEPVALVEPPRLGESAGRVEPHLLVPGGTREGLRVHVEELADTLAPSRGVHVETLQLTRDLVPRTDGNRSDEDTLSLGHPELRPVSEVALPGELEVAVQPADVRGEAVRRQHGRDEGQGRFGVRERVVADVNAEDHGGVGGENAGTVAPSTEAGAALVGENLQLVGTALAVAPEQHHNEGRSPGAALPSRGRSRCRWFAPLLPAHHAPRGVRPLHRPARHREEFFMNASARRIESGTIRRGRVLVVDDEAFEGRKLAQTLIEHSVVAVGSGADALAVIAVGRPYDLVLCDVMLRDMTGVELLLRLRRDHPDQAQRLVFMARPQLSPVLQYLLDGVSNLCVEVPFDMDGLRALVERRTRSFSSALLG